MLRNMQSMTIQIIISLEGDSDVVDRRE